MPRVVNAVFPARAVADFPRVHVSAFFVPRDPEDRPGTQLREPLQWGQ